MSHGNEATFDPKLCAAAAYSRSDELAFEHAFLLPLLKQQRKATALQLLRLRDTTIWFIAKLSEVSQASRTEIQKRWFAERLLLEAEGEAIAAPTLRRFLSLLSSCDLIEEMETNSGEQGVKGSSRPVRLTPNGTLAISKYFALRQVGSQILRAHGISGKGALSADLREQLRSSVKDFAAEVSEALRKSHPDRFSRSDQSNGFSCAASAVALDAIFPAQGDQFGNEVGEVAAEALAEISFRKSGS